MSSGVGEDRKEEGEVREFAPPRGVGKSGGGKNTKEWNLAKEVVKEGEQKTKDWGT